MRTHIRSSTEYRRRSSGNADSLSVVDPFRRRSMNLTPGALLEVPTTRRFSLAASTVCGVKNGTDPNHHSIKSTGSNFSFSSFISRRSSLPVRVGHTIRFADQRHSSSASYKDDIGQELNYFRIKVLVVCFVVGLSIAMFVLYLRASRVI